MKVLHVLPANPWCGYANIGTAAAEAMLKRGDEVWVTSPAGETRRRLRAAGARVAPTPFWLQAAGPFDAIAGFSLLRLCRRERFDLVVTYGGYIARTAAALVGIPRIVHHFDHGCESTAGLWLRRAAERCAAGFCDRVIFTREQHRRDAVRQKIGAVDKLRTVEIGVDAARLAQCDRAAARRRFGFEPGEIIIGFVGRMTARKGLEHMIRALPAIVAAFPTVRLAIAGEGPAEDGLRSEANHVGMPTRVTFLGTCREIPDFLAAIDLFVDPSPCQGLSMSVVEAMAAGKPIVAGDNSAIREILSHDDNCLLVKPGRSAELVGGVCRLLSEPWLAQRLVRQAREDAVAQFAADRMVRQLIDVYDDVPAEIVRRPRFLFRWIRRPA